MKKLLILWFILLLVVKCSSEKQQGIYVLQDPLVNAYSFSNYQVNYHQNNKNRDKEEIGNHLNYFLTKYNKHWSEQNKNKCIEILYCSEKQFKIDHRIILSLIAIESQFNINAVGKNKKSKDYGLTQQNEKYIKQRYKNAEQYLEQFKIKYTDSKFDISKNIISCFIYLHDINEYSDLIQFSDYISAYNQGIRGCKRNNNNKYYEKFLREYLSI